MLCLRLPRPLLLMTPLAKAKSRRRSPPFGISFSPFTALLSSPQSNWKRILVMRPMLPFEGLFSNSRNWVCCAPSNTEIGISIRSSAEAKNTNKEACAHIISARHIKTTNGRSGQHSCPDLSHLFTYNVLNRKRKQRHYVQRRPNVTHMIFVCTKVYVERNFFVFRVVKEAPISTFIMRGVFSRKIFLARRS